MNEEGIVKFTEIFFSVFVSVIFANYVNVIVDKYKKRSDVVTLIGIDLLVICTPAKAASIFSSINSNKIYNSELEPFRSVLRKYRLIAKHIRGKYLDIRELVECVDEVIGLIDEHYMQDIRYESA